MIPPLHHLTMQKILLEFFHLSKPHKSAKCKVAYFVEGPVWLRTCYSSDLDEVYEELAARSELYDGYGIDSRMVLDDSSIYNFSLDWSKILTRIPMLCDFIQGSVLEDCEVWEQHETGEGEQSELERASVHAHTLVYVVDEEAIKERVVKLMWLDSHGNRVWDNKMNPESLSSLQGALAGSVSLYEEVEEGGGDVESPRRGATLRR